MYKVTITPNENLKYSVNIKKPIWKKDDRNIIYIDSYKDLLNILDVEQIFTEEGEFLLGLKKNLYVLIKDEISFIKIEDKILEYKSPKLYGEKHTYIFKNGVCYKGEEQLSTTTIDKIFD